MLQLQATVKRFLFDLHLNLEGQHTCSLVYGFKDKSRRTDMVNQTRLKARLNHQIFMFFGHNVLIYCAIACQCKKKK